VEVATFEEVVQTLKKVEETQDLKKYEKIGVSVWWSIHVFL